jgi:hypothetical protein
VRNQGLNAQRCAKQTISDYKIKEK